MTRLMAIDPGTYRSAWVLLEDGLPIDFGYEANVVVLDRVKRGDPSRDVLVIEEVRSYGMPVGREVFDTVRFTGRLEQASRVPVAWLGRKEIVTNLCGSPKAKDPNVRRALLDRFGPAGTKASPGPTYGISGDVWAALAVAATYVDLEVSK
jgi:hypothetical protein